MSKVTVVDYGMGNIYSVSHALEHCGATVKLTSDPAEILAAELLLIPGVGAFADGMLALRERGLVEPIRHYAASGKPVMGICLGMQMLFEVSEEFGEHEGLGLIPGRVRAVPAQSASGVPHKIPHIGWNQLAKPDASTRWENTILDGLSEQDAFYFVHSFAAVPARPADRLADCDYDGVAISAAVHAGNISGCQFHPEKSGNSGLHLIRNFLRLRASVVR